MQLRMNVVAIALVVAAACGKTDKHAEHRNAVERHRAAVERTFAALAELEAASLPAARDELGYRGPPPTRANTIVLAAGPDVIPKLRLDRFESSDPIFDNAYAREVNYQLRGRFLGSAADVERGLVEFTALRYALLIETTHRDEWRLAAEAHLFAIDGTYYGGVRFEASGSTDLRDKARKALHDRIAERIPQSDVP